MNEKLGLEPAFPQPPLNTNEGYVFVDGMSKRLLIAKDILCAMISNKRTKRIFTENGLAFKEVNLAYDIANELLKQESE